MCLAVPGQVVDRVERYGGQLAQVELMGSPRDRAAGDGA